MHQIETKGMMEQFQAHLNNTNNQRIIFSGSFGSGKTTFLNNFFNDSAQQEKYYVCKLFPVNYVTSTNKDIYELIKFDILIQLLGTGITIERTDLEKVSTICRSVKSNALKLLQSILGVASLIDENTVKLGKAIEVIANIYKDYKDDSPKTKVEQFLNDLENELGTSYEMNDISNLIREMLIKASKLENRQKETILLIDDFDRLEPLQSFRLLNILSTNDNETGTGENKFGFDKIVIVCDINNLRDCFIHINGTNKAFNGYIDKFYSTEIFRFDIRNDLVKVINTLFSQINMPPDVRSEFFDRYLDIIQAMINCGEINVRTITKIQEAHIEIIPTKTLDGFYKICDYAGLLFFVLKKMFADDYEVSNAILACSLQEPLSPYRKNSTAINEVLCLLYPSITEKQQHELSIYDNKYTFNIQKNGYYSYWKLVAVNGVTDYYALTFPVFHLLDRIKYQYLNIPKSYE